MARRAGVSGDANGNAATGSVVVVAIPSRHGEVFAAAYKRETVVMAPRIVATAALDSWIAAEPRPVARVGVGGTAVGPRARDIASLAFAAASQRPSGHGDALAPTYLAAPPVDAAVLARYRP
ncbi:MAG: hypothetical protein HYY84_15280 [Deltaproteobacteria bacterium]|nr:hypothetical protein [Deltaproteobacteria bacterium]